MRMLRILLAVGMVGALVTASVGVALHSNDHAFACEQGQPPQNEHHGVYGVVREVDLDKFAFIHRDEIAFARLDVRAVRFGTVDPPVPAGVGPLGRSVPEPVRRQPLDVYMRVQDAWHLEAGDCLLVYGPYGVINCGGTCDLLAWFVDTIAVGLWADSVTVQGT